MILQYDGTRYQGWQKQTRTDNTIQGKLETLLMRLAEEEGIPQEIQVNGAGRTDAGVHAKGQVASFHMETGLTVAKLWKKINQYLPEDIAVISMAEAPERFHARLNAQGKLYRYRIDNSEIPNVFERRYVYAMPQQLDLAAMQEAAQYFVGKHDFLAFCSKHSGKKSTERTIEAVRVESKDSEIDITFTGDGFLYHMVRIMTGTLIEVGLHKREPASIPETIENRMREQAGFLAPASGLVLEEVYYA